MLVAFERHRGQENLAGFLDLFEATGATRDQIEAFLGAELDGQITVQDCITADMANQLLHALGQSKRQTADDVRRLRDRGAWRAYDQPPGE